MALTITPVTKMTWGNARVTIQTVTIGVAGDYSSGLTLTAANLRLGSLTYASVIGSNALGVSWYWDQSTSKLRGMKGNGVAEFVEAAGADVAGDVLLVLAVGDNANKG